MRTALKDPIRQWLPDSHERAFYEAEGYLLVKGLLDADLVAAFRDEVLAVLRGRNMPDSYLAQTGEYLAGGLIHGLVRSARLQAAVSALMDGPATPYLPFTAVKGPHQDVFGFHQDNQYTPLDGPACNCWFAIENCDIAHGCLRMVPRSHLNGTLPAQDSKQGHRMIEQPKEWLELEMEPGDCCIFTRLTVHASGANVTDTPRISYALQYHRDDVRGFFDGKWQLLKEHPRWRTEPVGELTKA